MIEQRTYIDALNQPLEELKRRQTEIQHELMRLIFEQEVITMVLEYREQNANLSNL